MTNGADGVDIEDFQRRILMELNFEAFRVLEQQIGEEKAREIFKPHMLNSGMALLINSQKLLGVEIHDAFSFLSITSFIDRAIWKAPKHDSIVTARGIEWHNPEGCYIASAPYSLRRMICEDAALGFTHPCIQDYEFLRYCVDMGDKECMALWRNRSDPSIDWKKLGGKDTIVPAPEFDKEKMRQLGILALGELWLFPTQALMEWKGLEAIPRLKDVMRPLGRKWGGELARVTGESAKDLSSLLSIFDTYNTIMGQEGRTIFSSTNKNEAEIIICPFSVAPNEMGEQCGEAIGAQCEAFGNGICEAASPDFELRFTTKMCTGGQNCHRVIRKKISARAVKEG